MQRIYRIWDAEAERAVLPLTDEASDKLVKTLASGRSVVVGDCVVMKVQTDDFFRTVDNPNGEYVYAVFGHGEVTAAAESVTSEALHEAVAWAAQTAAEFIEYELPIHMAAIEQADAEAAAYGD